MANTVIQIKRSAITTAPTAGSLSAAEPAYSYLSDKLFIGSSDGSQVIEIGGRFYINTAVRADQTANAATILGIAAFDKANAANLLAYNTGIGANAWANSVGVATGASSNAWANSVGVATGASSNAWANSISGSAGTAANNYANATFVKLVAASQTITGNLAVTGGLTVSGNSFSIDTETLRVSDPLIYLAGNNYVSDIVDIGFVANYNTGSANLHTGIFRDATVKEYFVFDGYDKEPIPNHIDTSANGFSLAVLNATIRTSNLILGGANAITTINNIGAASNAWANSVGAGANAYTALAFNKANAAVQTGFVTISAGGTSLVADSNTDTLTITSANGVTIVGDAGADSMVLGLSPTGVTATSYGGSATVGTFVVNEWGRITSAGNTAIAIDAAAITSGILSVPRGGTGVGTFTSNGILFGNTAGSLKVTAAGTEGQVLQASAAGIPSFGMLDGGTF